MDSGLILDSQAAMGSAKVVWHHREPTHPAVIPAGFGKRQRLSYFALIVQAARAILTFYHTRIDLVIAQQRQRRFQLGLAPNHLEVNPVAGGFNQGQSSDMPCPYAKPWGQRITGLLRRPFNPDFAAG